MKTLISIIGGILLASVCHGPSATIPAGTILTVQTLQTVSSIDMAGTPVPMQLESPVAVNGRVVLSAGTDLSAKVITSRQLASSTDRLTVNLTSVHVGGRNIPVTTTGPKLLANYINRSNNVRVLLAYDTVAAGKRMQFQLAQPLVL